MIPDYLIDFLHENNLEKKDIEIPEEQDLSGVGADFFIMDEKGMQEETNEYYPGLVVKEDGYIGIGSCAIGSGDPYFINYNDGPEGPLYRIYHDSVSDEGYEKSEAIDIVLSSYMDIKKYIV